MSEKQPPLKSFPVPDPVSADAGAIAIMSAWVGKGGLHIAAQRAFEKPEMWGMFLIDVAKHASNMYAQQGVMPQREAMTRILAVLSKHTGGQMDSGHTTIL